jgi:hypothetical protein
MIVLRWISDHSDELVALAGFVAVWDAWRNRK